MLRLPALLFASGAAVAAILGAIHLYTLASAKFLPRDPGLKERLEAVSPVLTRETTMWKTWIGLHISHSLGLLLFGAIYGYLAVFRLQVLLDSTYLLIVGAALLIAYLVLCQLYWFRVPFGGVGLALTLYIAGVIAGIASR